MQCLPVEAWVEKRQERDNFFQASTWNWRRECLLCCILEVRKSYSALSTVFGMAPWRKMRCPTSASEIFVWIDISKTWKGVPVAISAKRQVHLKPRSQAGQAIANVRHLLSFRFTYRLLFGANTYPTTSQLWKRPWPTHLLVWTVSMKSMRLLNLIEESPSRNVTTTRTHLHQHRYPYQYHQGVRSSQSSWSLQSLLLWLSMLVVSLQWLNELFFINQ